MSNEGFAVTYGNRLMNTKKLQYEFQERVPGSKPRFTIIIIVSILAMLMSAKFTYADNLPKVYKAQLPSWVNKQSFRKTSDIPYEKLIDGEYFILVDKQIKVTESTPAEYFEHYAIHVVNENGLEASSQISVNFAPEYQKLVFHQLNIYRKGEKINKLQKTKIETLRRETRMESLIYDGIYTANIIIDDVQIDDIIEYSFSIIGDNPIFNNIFSYGLPVSWEVPVRKHCFVIHWPKNKPFYQKSLKTGLTLMKIETSDYDIYSLHQENIKPVPINSESPSWYQSFGKIQISEIGQWSDVVAWALPLYQVAYEKSAEASKKAKEIKEAHVVKDDQIITALNYTQKKIRYLGIEIGKSSHKPRMPDETIRRLYGDCKDKSVALIALLNAMDIDAKPALVNTYAKQSIRDWHPSVNAFNHVIVRVKNNGEYYWLDPTRKFQGKNLKKVFQPNYGVALIISPTETELTAMPDSKQFYQTDLMETYDLRAGINKSAEYTVETMFFGSNAEYMRHSFAERGLAEHQKNYLNFYSQYHSGIKVTSPIEYIDDETENRLVIKERYHIDNFWEQNDEKNQFEGYFFAWEVNRFLDKPEQRIREEPFSWRHPVNLTQTIHILLPESWDIDNSEFTEKNQHFQFYTKTAYDGTTHTIELVYQFQTFKDAIMPDEIPGFIASLEKVYDELNFWIFSSISHTQLKSNDEGFSPWIMKNLYLIFLILLVLIIGYIFLEWFLDMRKPAPEQSAVYYPVSLIKLFILTISTYGFYHLFWFYKTWKYIQKRDDSAIMPFWRTFFSVFWFYPLYSDLKHDSHQRFNKNILPASFWIVLLLILYVILSIMSDFDSIFGLAYLLTGLCVIPFVNYVNYINRDAPEVISFNSRFRPRHIIMGIMVFASVSITVATEFYIIPSDQIVEGYRLQERDIKFLQQKGLVKNRDDLKYFYSDDFWTLRNDGNGITNDHVFSFWRDEETGVFNIRKANYSEIKNIDVKYAQESENNTTITIIGKDDSEFILFASKEKGKDRKLVREIEKKLNEYHPDN